MLCTDKVRVVGDPIAIVVAETRYQAEDACELVDVEIDDLPAVVSAEAALDPASPAVFEDLDGNVFMRKDPVAFGDIDAAFARADRVIRAHISQHRHQNVPMEGRGIVADSDPATEYAETLHKAAGMLHALRTPNNTNKTNQYE